MTNIETKQCKKVGVGGLACPCCRPKNTHFHNYCPCCQRNPTPPTRQAGAPANSEKKRRIRRSFKKRARRDNKNMCKQEN